jgi:hypothetical protein
MRLRISPKDSTCKLVVEGVAAFYQEGSTLAVVFEDGSIRNYPLVHIWYYEKMAEQADIK